MTLTSLRTVLLSVASITLLASTNLVLAQAPSFDDEDLKVAAVGCFGADQTVMAFTDDATLLVATNFASPLPAINIETVIERRLQGNVTSKHADIGISVGGPVQPQGTKSERARMVMDRVIALAEIRALEKHGRPVAGLFRR